MPNHDVIVIGASAGGVEALRELVRGFPADLPAAVFVVLHVPSQGPSLLPEILTRAGNLPATHAVDGEAFAHGRVYIAPPNCHMLVEAGCVRVVHGPRENRHRPAIDPLFRSAARAFGQRVVGVILTGALDDGTAGLLAVKMHGGLTVVQDPREALYPSMPRSALEHVEVDHCLPLSAIPPLLVNMTRTPTEREGAYPMPENIQVEPQLQSEPAEYKDLDKYGKPAVCARPE